MGEEFHKGKKLTYMSNENLAFILKSLIFSFRYNSNNTFQIFRSERKHRIVTKTFFEYMFLTQSLLQNSEYTNFTKLR